MPVEYVGDMDAGPVDITITYTCGHSKEWRQNLIPLTRQLSIARNQAESELPCDRCKPWTVKAEKNRAGSIEYVVRIPSAPWVSCGWNDAIPASLTLSDKGDAYKVATAREMYGVLKKVGCICTSWGNTYDPKYDHSPDCNRIQEVLAKANGEE